MCRVVSPELGESVSRNGTLGVSWRTLYSYSEYTSLQLFCDTTHLSGMSSVAATWCSTRGIVELSGSLAGGSSGEKESLWPNNCSLRSSSVMSGSNVYNSITTIKTSIRHR